MKDIFNPIYRQDYLEGYTYGQDPYAKFDTKTKNEAFNDGFHQGRLNYESMNGSVRFGIPQLIVTNKVLEDFLLAGMLGMSISAEGYSPFQIDVIQKWYQSGVEKYDANQSIYLLAILEQNGIEII
ncbi:hypothetical protein [Flavobacterium sp. XGLA_31]|uniref:hypothetical protein n=1 Tax=Flavobacterium sp. XGLA_31 TaxID=3447666 RepID=UPI003F34B4FE